MKLDAVDIICFILLALCPFVMAYGLIKGEEERLEWYSHHCETIEKLKYGEGEKQNESNISN